MPKKTSRRALRDRLLILCTVLFASGMIYFQALAQEAGRVVPDACLNAGITDTDACATFLNSTPTPAPGDAGTTPATTANENASVPVPPAMPQSEPATPPSPAPEPQPTVARPKPCIEKGIDDPDDCRKLMESIQSTQPTKP